MFNRLIFSAVIFTATVFGGGKALYADNKAAQVKAVFLYNFINFTTWPDSSDNTGRLICIYGSDPFGSTIDYIVSKDPQKIRPTIKRISKISEISGCSILYASSATSNMAALLSSAKENSALAVSDAEGFAGSGGMIGYVNKDNRIKLQVNRTKVSEANLKLSSKLLEMAEIVQ